VVLLTPYIFKKAVTKTQSGSKKGKKVAAVGKSTKKARAKKGSPTNLDGGRTALAGFLYQILAGTGFLELDEPQTGPEAFLRLEPEQFNQDWHLVDGRNPGERCRLLIQCKFSSAPEEHPIRQGDYKAILKGLEMSEEEAQHVERLPTYLVLCTNRSLSPRCKESARLKYHRFTKAEAEANLADFASRLGIYDREELRVGRAKLIGEILEISQSRESQGLTRQQLMNALAGFSHACSIRFSDIAGVCRERLGTAIGVQGIKLTNSVERVRALRRLDSIGNAALVAVVGDGGCGKSVFLGQLLEAALSNMSNGKIVSSL
jgi:hypothetical protein